MVIVRFSPYEADDDGGQDDQDDAERRLAFVRAGAEWLLDEEDEVIEILRESGGDPVRLARMLNDQADCCVLIWLPENARLSQPQVARFRHFALAMKAAAVGR